MRWASRVGASITAAMSNSSTGKRSRRNIVVGPGIDKPKFAIDEDDFLVIAKMLCRMGYAGQIWTKTQTLTSIREDDDERRVRIVNALFDLDSFWVAEQQQPPVKLPENLGTLTDLEVLDLGSLGITSLPPSIRQLRSLKTINLSNCFHLKALPCEIGELTNLEYFNLNHTKLSNLPENIGNLVNLKDLRLVGCHFMRHLPYCIGNLVNLETLNIYGSNIVSLPGSLGRLPDLLSLNIDETPMMLEVREQEQTTFLMDLLQRCRSVGYLGVQCGKKVQYAMACNRARYRTGFGRTNKKSIRRTPKLWPCILYQALRAYRYHESNYEICYEPIFPSTSLISKPDAIYQLLLDGRESFLEVLLDRHTNDRISNTKGDRV